MQQTYVLTALSADSVVQAICAHRCVDLHGSWFACSHCALQARNKLCVIIICEIIWCVDIWYDQFSTNMLKESPLNSLPLIQMRHTNTHGMITNKSGNVLFENSEEKNGQFAPLTRKSTTSSCCSGVAILGDSMYMTLNRLYFIQNYRI
jgi:hypothetical protein